MNLKRAITAAAAAATITVALVVTFRITFAPAPESQIVIGDAVKPVTERARWPEKVRIGYFHGGRTIIFYRTQIFREFERSGVDVELMTRNLKNHYYFPMPDLTIDRKVSNLGKTSGSELAKLVANGTFQGATIGETAFIQAVRSGLPLVAVAELGHDVRDGAGHALVLRKGVKINGRDSLRGLRLGSRRSAGGDEVVLREFVSHMGLNPDRDVKIIPNINDDVFGEMITRGQLDGAYGHLLAIQKWMEKKDVPVYIHRQLDWIDPEMSLSVLVFHKDFVEKYPGSVQRIVTAYVRRVRMEWAMPVSEKRVEGQKGVQIEMDFNGLNLPEHRQVPMVQIQLLNEWQKLLVKHGALDRTVDLKTYVDNSFVERAGEELY